MRTLGRLMVYHIYCDESRQSKDRFMVIGGIIIPSGNVDEFNDTMQKFRLEQEMFLGLGQALSELSSCLPANYCILFFNVSNRIVLGKSIIAEAGLGEEIEILVQEGAIFILPAVKPDGWKALEALGKDATKGVLESPSEHHNHYLYGARKQS